MMTALDPSDTAEDRRSMSMTRVLPASRALVWETLTDPRHIPFFWGPRGFSTTTSEMDVRVGGYWRFVMHGQDRDFINWVRYTEVQVPALLAYDHGGETDEPMFRARIELAEEGPDKTRIHLRLVFPTVEARDHAAEFGAVEGGHDTLARLDEEIAARSTDLALTRIVDAPRALVWKAWTEPEHLKQWFCPRPWITADCRIDRKPGGEFYTLMRGPNGEEGGGTGCFLEVVPQERLIWTGALLPGFRPAPPPATAEDAFLFTAIITLEDHAGRTRYTARVLHADEAGRHKHEEMGFHHGWNAALDQLVELVRTMD